MKINIQSRKNIKNSSLNLKRTFDSRVVKQYQFFDFSCYAISGFKRVTVFTALSFGLICNPYLAHAENALVTSKLQTVAESYAQELGDMPATGQWIRIEFRNTYIDPVVVVEEPIANGDNSYVVGIRNVDAMGFEVSLKTCNNSTDIPVQENVSYAVIEKSQLPLTEGANAEVRQQFSWGECATTAAAADTTTRKIL